MKRLSKKGFTIVELVIVIAVIAILAAVLIPTFSGVVARANASAAQQTAMTAVKASLLMTSNAALPDKTLILINFNKNPEKAPDIGYQYDGNALGESPIKSLTKKDAGNKDVFDTSLFYGKKTFSLLVSADVISTKETDTDSHALTVDGMLSQTIKFMTGENEVSSGAVSGAVVRPDTAGISYSILTDKSGNSYFEVERNGYKFSIYVSSDIPKSAFVVVPAE